jgi:hypothetical protein
MMYEAGSRNNGHANGFWKLDRLSIAKASREAYYVGDLWSRRTRGPPGIHISYIVGVSEGREDLQEGGCGEGWRLKC